MSKISKEQKRFLKALKKPTQRPDPQTPSLQGVTIKSKAGLVEE